MHSTTYGIKLLGSDGKGIISGTVEHKGGQGNERRQRGDDQIQRTHTDEMTLHNDSLHTHRHKHWHIRGEDLLGTGTLFSSVQFS